jgi:hypothetical protein
MRSGTVPIVILAAALLCGCGAHRSSEDSTASVDLATLPGVYVGTFPCLNCPGADARLWLRPDGVFFLREDFRADEVSEAERSYALGRWAWDTATSELVLRGRGPERRFAYAPPGRLQMQVPGAPHVLERDATARRFADRLPLEGKYDSSEGFGTFLECVTGLRFAVRGDADGPSLRRRHRAVSPADRALWVSIEAHIVYADPGGAPTESLAVDRVVTLRPGGEC